MEIVAKWRLIIITSLTLYFSCSPNFGQTDECLSTVFMDNLDSGNRYPNFTAGVSDPTLCDYQLDENAWYRFDSRVTTQMTSSCVQYNRCGTTWPIWLSGNHPTSANPGPVNVTVCSPDSSGSCCGQWSSTIQVKFCPVANSTNSIRGMYIYKLKNVPYCDMAYCADEGDGRSQTDPFPAQTANPKFRGPVNIPKTQGSCTYTDFYFECEVMYSPQVVDNRARFDVSLTFDGQPDATKPATRVTTDAAALVVRFDSITIRGNVGKKVGCQVQSYWLNEETRSSVLHSNESYWVGVRMTSPDYNPATNHFIMTSASTLVIDFSPTVPLGIGCTSSLSFYYQHPNQGLSKSDCQVYFREDKLTHRLLVRPNPQAGCNQYTSAMIFDPFNKPLPIQSLWTNYTINNVVILTTCTHPLSRCSSTYDPVIGTFDGSSYMTYNLNDDFLLMRSQVGSRLFEVHVRHASYYDAVSVNCAVAVREGNDILGIYMCNGSAPILIRYLRDPNTPPGKADIKQYYGIYYDIVMPSGAHVEVTVSSGGFLQINVYPLREDAFHTTGLCGNYDLSVTDDQNEFYQISSSGYNWCSTNCERYRLASEASYINGHVYFPKCVNSSLLATICRCDKNNQTAFDCSPSAGQAPVPVRDTTGTYRCDSSRNMRSAGDLFDDDVIMPGDIPVPPTVIDPSPPPVPTWPTRSGITQDQATNKCRAVLESFSAYNVCKDFVDMQRTIHNCEMNILVTDSLDAGVDGLLDEFKTSCVFNIESTVNTTDSDSRPPAVSELLRNVTYYSCPNQCSDRGRCIDSVCSCDSGYLGDDCSLSANAVPTLTSIRRGGACDARQFACTRIYVTADDILETNSLTCRFTSPTSSVPPADATRPAVYVSKWELACDLPASPINDKAIHSWSLSVSNDGQRYGNVLATTVYDSLCQNCDAAGSCTQKTTACYISGKCYSSGDVNPSNAQQRCIPTSNISGWTEVLTSTVSTTTTTPSSANSFTLEFNLFTGHRSLGTLALLVVTAHFLTKLI